MSNADREKAEAQAKADPNAAKVAQEERRIKQLERHFLKHTADEHNPLAQLGAGGGPSHVDPDIKRKAE